MGKIVCITVIAFFLGCLTEGALRDYKTVEKLQIKVDKLHDINCKLATEKSIKLADCEGN